MCGDGGQIHLTQPSASAFDDRIVCEVSTSREVGPKNFQKQLKCAFAHCPDDKKRKGVSSVYGLLLNHADVSKDKNIQKVYLDFVKNQGLGLRSTIRLVPMRAAEFVTALRRLYAEDSLWFDSRLLATALNGLHRKLRGEIPTERNNWMAKDLVENIKKALEREPNLFEANSTAPAP